MVSSDYYEEKENGFERERNGQELIEMYTLLYIDSGSDFTVIQI